MQNFEMSSNVVVSGRIPPSGSFMRQYASFPSCAEGPEVKSKQNHWEAHFLTHSKNKYNKKTKSAISMNLTWSIATEIMNPEKPSFFAWPQWEGPFTRSCFSVQTLTDSPISCTLLPSVLWRCWLGGRKGIRPVKNIEWWGTGMAICLERDADLHMAQLMPLPLTVSCFSNIQIGVTFLVPDHLGSPGKRAVKRVCVRVLPLKNPRTHYSPKPHWWTGKSSSWKSAGFFINEMQSQHADVNATFESEEGVTSFRAC